GVLQHVGGLVAVAADAQRQGEHRPLEPAVELFERRPLAGPRARQQRGGNVDGEGRGWRGGGWHSMARMRQGPEGSQGRYDRGRGAGAAPTKGEIGGWERG